MKRPSVRRMAAPGHYRPPKMPGVGGMNMPGRGRVGKAIPSPKLSSPRPFQRKLP